jgi:hypothetical protein
MSQTFPLRYTHSEYPPVPAKHRVLDKLAVLNHLFKLFHRCKVIVDAVVLSRSRFTGGVGDGKAERVRVSREQAVEKGGFACSRRSADDERLRPSGVDWKMWVSNGSALVHRGRS